MQPLRPKAKMKKQTGAGGMSDAEKTSNADLINSLENELGFLRQKIERFEKTTRMAMEEYKKGRFDALHDSDPFEAVTRTELRALAVASFDLESVAFGIIFEAILPQIKRLAAEGQLECEFCYFHIPPIADEVARAAMRHAIDMLRGEPFSLDVTELFDVPIIRIKW